MYLSNTHLKSKRMCISIIQSRDKKVYRDCVDIPGLGIPFITKNISLCFVVVHTSTVRCYTPSTIPSLRTISGEVVHVVVVKLTRPFHAAEEEHLKKEIQPELETLVVGRGDVVKAEVVVPRLAMNHEHCSS